MGSVNYIVIPELKIKFTINRTITNEYKDISFERIAKIANIEYESAINKPLKDLVLQDIGKILNVAETVNGGIEYFKEYGFLMFLESRNIQYDIITEFDEKNSTIYKDFKIID